MRNIERLIVYPTVIALICTVTLLYKEQRTLQTELARQALMTTRMVQEQTASVSEETRQTTTQNKEDKKVLDSILAPFYNGASEVGKLLDLLPDLSPVSH